MRVQKCLTCLKRKNQEQKYTHEAPLALLLKIKPKSTKTVAEKTNLCGVWSKKYLISFILERHKGGKNLELFAEGTTKETGRRRRLEGNISALSRQPVSQLLISRAGASSVNHGTTGAACDGCHSSTAAQRARTRTYWGFVCLGEDD